MTTTARETRLHRVADSFIPRLSVAVRLAFARGRKALGNGKPNVEAAVTAIRSSLADTLPKALRRIYVAGGEVAAGGLKAAEWDESKHPRDEQGQWTTSGGGGGKKPSTLTVGRVKRGWHLTANPKFVPDPTLKPELASIAGDLIEDPPAGLFVGDPEFWMHAHGYERPYVAQVEGTVTNPPGTVMYPGHEEFMQGQMQTVRVLTIDEYAREVYHDRGWVEEYFGEGPKNVPKDYVARSVAEMSSSEIAEWERKFAEYARRPDGPLARAERNLRTAKRTTRKIGPFAFRFDATSEEAIAWADRHAAELIDGITETSREAINNAVAEALETGDLRELYDEILAAVGDEDRAELIARTEVMTAANEGQREAWRQAADEGLLAGTERVTWIATPDDRTCPICSDLDGQTRDFDGQYAGGYDGPPAHPRCRCTEGLA